jgi:hypothetical protein
VVIRGVSNITRSHNPEDHDLDHYMANILNLAVDKYSSSRNYLSLIGSFIK